MVPWLAVGSFTAAQQCQSQHRPPSAQRCARPVPYAFRPPMRGIERVELVTGGLLIELNAIVLRSVPFVPTRLQPVGEVVLANAKRSSNRLQKHIALLTR